MPKKKGSASGSRHRGPTPRNPNKSTSAVIESPGTSRAPVASARFTPKVRARGPFRPTWHKVVGASLIALGLGIFVLNDLAWFDINLIPGGHSELWAMAGIGVAVSSTWWFGWFDRTPKPTR